MKGEYEQQHRRSHFANHGTSMTTASRKERIGYPYVIYRFASIALVEAIPVVEGLSTISTSSENWVEGKAIERRERQSHACLVLISAFHLKRENEPKSTQKPGYDFYSFGLDRHQSTACINDAVFSSLMDKYSFYPVANVTSMLLSILCF